MKRIVLLISAALVLTMVVVIAWPQTAAAEGCPILEFQAVGSVDGEWVGHFIDPTTGAVGTLEVETLSFTRLDETLHLVQKWTLFPPDPAYPPDPCFPPDPIIPVEMQGTLNLADGTLVLDGTRESDGLQAQVRGEVVFREDGTISVSGELMSNPQPEPPLD